MQRLDLVWQARAYVNQAKQTASYRQKMRLLNMAQRLLRMDAQGSTGLVLIGALQPQWPQSLRRAS
jgi:hypothetical protein